MGADPAPDDVRLAFDHWLAVDERRPTVGSPRQLEDALCGLDAFDAKPRPEPVPSFEVIDESPHSKPEPLFQIRRKLGVIAIELRRALVGRHDSLVERSEKLL